MFGGEWGFGKTVQEGAPGGPLYHVTLRKLDDLVIPPTSFPLGDIGLTETAYQAVRRAGVSMDELRDAAARLLTTHGRKTPPPGVDITECMVHFGDGPKGVSFRAATWFHPQPHTVIALAEEAFSVPTVGAA